MKINAAQIPIRRMFLNLVLFRIFLPLVFVGLAAISGTIYIGQKVLLNQQGQVIEGLSKVVDVHLEQGGRVLDAIARIAETEGSGNLAVYMDSTWRSYGYFETIYYLDRNNKIALIMPSDTGYAGLDMSNLPDFKMTKQNKTYRISRPFISIRTGEPTVYLVRTLMNGDSVVGELNLGLFQKEIERISTGPGKYFVFILDQSGTLLAYPNPVMVRQQVNLSNLGIFHQVAVGKDHDYYIYNSERMIGSATRIAKTGWVIVAQISLLTFLGTYAWTVVLIFLASILIWLTLAWSIRKRIQRYVVAPLEQLSMGANALAQGDFSKIELLQATPSSFAELHKLASDFNVMSKTLQTREADLQKAHDELETRVKDRTEQLSVINENLVQTSEDLQLSNMHLQSEIAERERAERQLAQKVAEIEMAHRKLKTAHLQILQQEKLASIGQLAAGVAHEINNPIGFINSNLGTLHHYIVQLLELLDAYGSQYGSMCSEAAIAQIKQKIDFDFIREDIEKLIEESISGASRVKHIVQDLQDFSYTGTVEWLLADISKGLDSTLNILSGELKKKAVVVCEYGELPQVECIPSQINQVFMNILINAAQAIPEHGQIVIRSGCSKDEVWVSIADNGNGIAPKDQVKIFDPFFSTQSIGNGAGLGLSVSHGIIKKHGGRIELKSQLGQGAVFTIYLPIRQPSKDLKDKEDVSGIVD